MSDGERQSPIGGTGEREEGTTPPLLSPVSPTSSEERAPSTVTYDRLPGSKPAKPEKPAGLGETQREKQADTETDETGDEKTATSDRPQKSSRKWPLEGFWGGIKERLKPADPDEKARKQEEQSDSGGSDIKEIGGAETVVEEESTVKESRAGRRTNTEGGGSRKKKKDVDKVTEEEKNGLDKGREVEGAGKRDRDSVVQKREELRGTHKQTRRPHSLHVASIVHRMETSEESVSSTEVREGPRSHPPSTRTGTWSARRRDKNVGTDQSPKPSKPKPSPKPKPENLKALSGSGSQDGSSTEVNQTYSQSTNTRLSATEQPRRPLSHKTQPQRSSVQQRHPTQQQAKVPTSQATQKPSSTRQQQQHSAVPRVSITTSETRTANGVSNLPILPAVVSENQTSPEGNFGRSGAAKPAPPPKRTKLDTAQITNTTLLTRLQQQAAENNYYQLMGVEPGASEEELARVRRERSRQLHPDHFASQPERQER